MRQPRNPKQHIVSQPESRQQEVRRLVAEALGSFIYVFLSGGAYATVRLLLHSLSHIDAAALLVAALAHGLAYFLAVTVISDVSQGHINPAVTVGLAAVNHFPRRAVLAQVVAQLVGALIGAEAIFIIYGQRAATLGQFGTGNLAPGTSLLQGCAIEGIGAAIFVVTLFAAKSNERTNTSMAALASGLAITAITLVIGPATTASINPARALGSDLALLVFGVQINWAAFFVTYLVGPLLGATIACVVFTLLAQPPQGKVY